MKIIDFDPKHISRLTLQDAQAWMGPLLDDRAIESMQGVGDAWTAISDDGAVLCCGGIIPIWDNRAEAWSLIAGSAGRSFVGIVRAMRQKLENHPARRIEITVDSDFEQGHRMACVLGFEFEGTMRGYLPSGRDCDLYARVRG
jgi:RimJ/RimL family protein N-acetyltransferase